MHFFRVLILGSTCSSERFRSGPTCSLVGVSECYELNLPNTLPIFLVTSFVAEAWLLTSLMQLLEDPPFGKWRNLLVRSRLILYLVENSTSIFGKDVWTWFCSNQLTAFVSLSTTFLITVICRLPILFWSCLSGKLRRALVLFGRV